MRYRALFEFRSLLKLSTLLGFCAGIGMIPVILLVQFDKLLTQPSLIAFTILATPVVGLVNGLLWGLLGYLPYRWLSHRANLHTFRGEFVAIEEHNGHQADA